MKNKRSSKLKNLTTIRILFLGVFSLVVITGIYLSFSTSKLLLSPEQKGLSYESARFYISKLGQDGIRWYCGTTESYTDTNGNQYGSRELNELKRIIGNDERLHAEFCE